jgi:Holliday junction resolvase RusA-like endonuclease
MLYLPQIATRIFSTPIPQERPRSRLLNFRLGSWVNNLFARGLRIVVFDPSENDKARFLHLVEDANVLPTAPYVGNLEVTLHFAFKGPPKRVDLDNLVKFVFDALNGHAWADDSQVVRLLATKEFHAAVDHIDISVVTTTHQAHLYNFIDLTVEN